MLRIIQLLAVLTLTGCAVTAERAAQMSESELCVAWMSPFLEGTDKGPIYRELNSRNVPIEPNCRIHWDNSVQMFNLGVQMMKESRQPPPTAVTECYQVGNTYRCEHYGRTYYDCYPTGSGYRCE